MTQTAAGAEDGAEVDKDYDEDDEIDDEEEGGEWITEENLAKHLTNGLMLPIVPVVAEDEKEDI